MGKLIRKQHRRSPHEEKGILVKHGMVIPIRDDRESATSPMKTAGRLLRGMFQFPYTFVAMNWAAVVGLYAFLRNRKNVWVRSSEEAVWEGVVEPIGMPVQSTESARKAA